MTRTKAHVSKIARHGAPPVSIARPNTASVDTERGDLGHPPYNSRLQLAGIDYAKGTTDLLNLTYNYNQTYNGNTVNNGQIQGITDTRGAAYSTSYTYDALGRLAQGQTLNLTAANTWKLGWLYDRYANRLQQNLLGGTISVTAPQLSINSATNRITNAGYTYDNSGNLQADGTGASYTYDAESRMKTFANGSNSATYSYDGKGLRVKKTVGANTTVYIFSGSKPIAEYTNGSLSAKYVYAGSQLLATLYPSTVTPVVYHYPDHLSARLETNPQGNVTRTFGHLPFGETWYETGISAKQKFTSYERDSETGLDYAMFRYDSSRLGRFMTADPLEGASGLPQSINRFSYVGGDPVNVADPLGLQWCPMVEEIDYCGGGQGGDAGMGGSYVNGMWTMGPFVAPSIGGQIPMWGQVWVPYENTFDPNTWTFIATTGYWQLTFLGYSGGGSSGGPRPGAPHSDRRRPGGGGGSSDAADDGPPLNQNATVIFSTVSNSFPDWLNANPSWSEKQCSFFDWTAAGMGFVAIPNATNPVGEILGLAATGVWVVGKLGNC